MNTVDNRVVQMEFDNRQFEQGVAESLKTLEELKKSLNFEDVATKADFSALADAVDNINDKFSALGIMGVTAMQRISNSVLDAGEKFVKSLSIDQIDAGFQKYATKTEAIQSLMAALPGVGKNAIYDAIGELNEYSDATSFDLASMATNLSMFVNNGVKLDTATQAIKGIGNAASLAGVSVQKTNYIMKNFSDALAAGSMKLIDWKSMEKLGIATKQFKEELIEAGKRLGKIDLNGHVKKANKTIRAMTVDYQNFSQTLSSGWVDAEVMMEVLTEYADTTTELGRAGFLAAKQARTFAEAIDAVKDAASSSWMRIFESIFGDVTEATELWTAFGDGIIDNYLDPVMSKIESIFSVWHDETGRLKIIEMFQNLNDVVLGIGDAIHNAWRGVFLPLSGRDLVQFSESLRLGSIAIKEWFGSMEDGNSRISKISSVLRGIFSIVKIVVDVVVAGVRAVTTVINTLFRILAPGFDGLLDVLAFIGAVVSRFLTSFNLPSFFLSLAKSIQVVLASALAKLPIAIDKVRSSLAKLVEKIKKSDLLAKGGAALQKIGASLQTVIAAPLMIVGLGVAKLVELIPVAIDKVGEFISKIKEWFKTSTEGQKWAAVYENVSKKVASAFSKITSVFSNILSLDDPWEAIKGYLKAGINKVADWIGIDDFVGVIQSKWAALKKKLTSAIESIKTFFSTLFSPAKDEIEEDPWYVKAGKRISSAWTSVMEALQPMIEKVKGFFQSFFSPKEEGEESQPWYVRIADKLKELFDAIKDKIAPTIEAVSEWFSTTLTPTVKGIIESIKTFFSTLFSPAKDEIEEDPWYVEDIEHVSQSLSTFNEQVHPILDTIGEWCAALFGISKAVAEEAFPEEPAEKKKTSFIDTLKGWLQGLSDFFSGIDLSKILLDITLVGAIAWELWKQFAVLRTVMNAATALKNISKVGVSYKGLFGNLQIGRANDPLESLYKIAKSVALIAGALVALTLVDPTKLRTALDTMVEMLAMLAGLAMLQKNKLADFVTIADALKGLGLAIGSIGVSLFLVAVAVATLGRMNFGSLAQGVIAVGIIAFLMYKLVASLAKRGVLKKGAQSMKGLISIALAILILAVPVFLLGNMNPSVLFKGVLAVGGLMLFVGVLLSALQAHKVGTMPKMSGLIAVALSVLLLAVPVILLGMLKPETLAKGVVAVGILIAAMGAILIAMTKFSSMNSGNALTAIVGLVVVVAAIYAVSMVLIEVAKNLGDISWEQMAGFAVMFAVVVAVMAAALAILSAANPGGMIAGAAAFAAASILLSVGFGVMAAVLGNSIQMIGEILFALGSNLKAFSEMLEEVDFEKVSGSMDLLKDIASKMVDIGTMVFGDIDAFIQKLVRLGGALHLYSNSIKEVDESKCQSISTVIQGLPDIKESIDKIADMQDASTAIGYLGAAIKLYFDEISGVDTSGEVNKTPEEIFKIFSDLAAAAPDPATFSAVSQYAGANEEGGTLFEFALGLEALGAATDSFGTICDGIRTEQLERVVEVLKSIRGLTESEDIVDFTIGPGFLSFSSTINTQKQTLSDFSVDIVVLGDAVNSFATATGPDKIDIAAVEQAVGVIERIAQLEVPTTGGLWGFIVGEENLATFGSRLNTLGEGFSKFSNNVTGTEFTGADTAVSIIQKLADVQNSLGNSGGLAQFITGSQNIGTLANPLKELGGGLGEFATSINGKDFTNVEASIEIIGKLADIQNIISGSGGLAQLITGSQNIGTLANPLKELGGGLGEFATSIAGKDFTNAEAAIKVIGDLAVIQSSLESSGFLVNLFSGVKDIGKVGEGLKSFASKVNEAGTDLANITWSKVDDAIVSLRKLITLQNRLPKNGSKMSFSDLGSDFYWMSEYINGIDENKLSSIGDLLATVMGTAPDGFVAYGENVGKKFSEAVGIGIVSTDGSFVTPQRQFANLLNAIQNVRSNQALYNTFKTKGTYIVKGLADGISNGVATGKSPAVTAMSRLSTALDKEISKKLEIESPSKVMRRIGMYIDQGLGQGIEAYSDVPLDQMSSTADSILYVVQSALDSYMSDDNEVTIRPVIDMTDFNSGAASLNSFVSGSHTVGLDTSGLSRYVDPVIDLSRNSDIVDSLTDIRQEISQLEDAITSMRVVLDTGPLVGSLTKPMDRSLGERGLRRSRGV